jgi:signal transduction histidine kinase
MLSRLDIGQKLSLLLLLPLVLVVLTVVPFTVERVDDARAAGATADAARLAGSVGELVGDLQQERLLGLAYLTSAAVDPAPVLGQIRQSTRRAEQLRQGLPDGTELSGAVDRAAALAPVRQQVLNRNGRPVAVFQAYDSAIQALLGSLRLTADQRVDANGVRQLEGLAALLQANEASSSLGAARLLTVTAPADGTPVLAAARLTAAREAGTLRGMAVPVGVDQLDLLDRTQRADDGRPLGTAARKSGAVTLAAGPLAAVRSADVLRQLVQQRSAADIAARADQRATASRWGVGLVTTAAAVLIALMVLLSGRIRASIASPLRRLARSATMVADLTGDELARLADSETDDYSPPQLAAVDVQGEDEIGELAAAFNRVQATAALMLDRQALTRRNVAVMFSNVAHRTQGLVGRQLALIDDMQRNEENEALLNKLYRLDHLTTRLRRSADSLLVVSGQYDDGSGVGPTSLSDVIRSAMAEIEGFQAVRLGAVCDATVSPEVVVDLRLLLAELMENATAFSPPGVPVEVLADWSDGCRILVVDHGVGMSPARMAEENQRLIERQRLEVAPSRLLGLFVVGRLARRHGITVRLDPTPGQGVTATVVVPPTQVSQSAGGDWGQRARAIGAGPRATRPEPPAPALETTVSLRPPTDGGPDRVNGRDPHFSWLAEQQQDRTPPAVDPLGSAPSAVAPSQRADRDADFHWLPGQPSQSDEVTEVVLTGGTGPRVGNQPPLVPPVEPPAAAETDRPTTGGSRGGLNRRQPGAYLPQWETFGGPPPRDTPSRVTPNRQAEAERDAMAAFAEGDALARRAVANAAAAGPPTPAAPVPTGRPVPGTPVSAAGRPGPVGISSTTGPARPVGPTQPSTRNGLTRRVPGASLAEGASDTPTADRRSAVRRDPAAERAAVDGFFGGFAQAGQPPAGQQSPPF